VHRPARSAAPPGQVNSNQPSWAIQQLSVSRETPAALASRFELPDGAGPRLERLLAALEAEPDPPTTVRAREEAIERHLADSLSGLEVEALAAAGAIADIGSGAGFPGLPLAIARPNARVDLIESARRKCEVIERLARAAGAERARAIPERVETWAAGEGSEAYDVATARAVAPLAALLEYASPLLRPGGVLVAWKGARAEVEERAAATAGPRLGMEPREVMQVVPFVGAEQRHLHVYEKTGPTPPGIPRRPGMATKRPLA
jgi:16S rRNA (guanine527-N7)-methyltransferase